MVCSTRGATFFRLKKIKIFAMRTKILPASLFSDTRIYFLYILYPDNGGISGKGYFVFTLRLQDPFTTIVYSASHHTAVLWLNSEGVTIPLHSLYYIIFDYYNSKFVPVKVKI